MSEKVQPPQSKGGEFSMLFSPFRIRKLNFGIVSFSSLTSLPWALLKANHPTHMSHITRSARAAGSE